MAVRISAEIDRVVTRRIRRSLNSVAKNIDKAGARAANRAATSSVAFFSRETRKQVYVKARRLKRNTRIRRARPSNPVAFIDVSGSHIPLADMGAPRQTRRGVTVRRYRNQGRQLVEGAFLAVMPTGHRGVYRRKGKPRLPIKEQWGPSVMTLWQKRERAINAHAITTLQKELARQIQLLRGAGR